MAALTLRRRFGIAFSTSTLLWACLYIAVIASAALAEAQQDQASNPEQPVAQFKPVRPIHIVPFGTPKKGQNPLISCTVTYYGGPVVSNVKIVVVYWGSHVSSVVTGGIPGFYQGVTNSVYYDLLSEYSTNITPHGGGSGTNQSIGRGSYMEADTIAPSICDGSSPCTLDDSDVQTEIINQINAGHLPAPEYDSQGNDNTLYMTYFPPDVTITQGGGASCQAGGFCAYHGTSTYNSKYLAYGVVPDFGPGGGCDSGCGAGTEFQNLTSVSSHELAETTTDMGVGLAPPTDAPPLAWYSDSCGEIGDGCNADETSITTPAGTYTVQKLWSNAKGACVASGLHPVYSLSAPASATPGTPFNFTLTALNPAGGKGTDISYIGTVHFISSDTGGGVTLPADYTFTSSDKGTTTFSATLETGGSQSITATDTVNSAITATASIQVKTATSIAVTNVSPASEPYGQDAQVTITAILSWTGNASAPTGAVTIGGTAPSNTYGTTSCGAPMSNTITCTNTYVPTASDVVGSYTMSAAFAGDSHYVSSSSTQSNNFSITQAGSTTAVISSQNPSVFGQSVMFTATITGQYGLGPVGALRRQREGRGMQPQAPVGSTVTWSANTGCGMTAVTSGSATCTTSSLGVGNDTITATYSGDSNHTGSVGTLSGGQTVNMANTTTSLLSSQNPSIYGQAISFTATVTVAAPGAGTPTGGVQFKIDNSNFGSAVSLVNGSATSNSISTLADGNHTVTALYTGDTNFVTSNGTLSGGQTVDQAPTITSANNSTFTVGKLGKFAVKTTGFPTPGVSENGALPSGVLFTDNHNGTGTLSGRAAAGTGGTYFFTITASNGVNPNATQNFTLTVDEAPKITSRNNTKFTKGMPGSFTITTTGFPISAITYSPIGSLPGGTSLVDNHNGTAALSGTPTVSGTFTFWVKASNGVGSPSSQSFTLTVKP